MKFLFQGMIFAAAFASVAAAQDNAQPQRVTVQFRDPSAPHKLEVRDLGRGDCPHELEPVQIVADAIDGSKTRTFGPKSGCAGTVAA